MSFLAIAEVKEFLEIGFEIQDTVVQVIIDGVEDFAERECGVKLTASEITEDHKGGSKALRPFIAPLNSITSIESVASDGTLELIEAAVYRQDLNRIVRFDGSLWDRNTLYRVKYNGGHAVVPNGLKHAMFQLARRSFDNRGGKQSQSAAGFGTTWMDMNKSDAMKWLRPFVITAFVG